MTSIFPFIKLFISSVCVTQATRDVFREEVKHPLANLFVTPMSPTVIYHWDLVQSVPLIPVAPGKSFLFLWAEISSSINKELYKELPEVSAAEISHCGKIQGGEEVGSQLWVCI